MTTSSERKGGSSARSQSILSTLTVPDGEDSFSFERHNRALKLEHGKVHPNKQVVEELMTQSFTMRWNDLHTNNYGLDTVFEKYPFLADVSEVSITRAYMHIHRCMSFMVCTPFNVDCSRLGTSYW